MRSRWVSVSYPDPPPESSGTVTQSFPVYYESDLYLESEGPVTVLLYADGACVAVITGSSCVHLCQADAAPEQNPDPDEITEEEHFRALGWEPGQEVPHGEA